MGLGNLPNAKSDDPTTDSSEILATTAALNRLQQQVGDSLTGMVANFAMSTPPSGWLKCNGAVVSRVTFSKLFERIGVVFGAGDGSTTFGLPDMRGLFPRGWADGGGIDAGRGFGTFQEMAFQSHNHAASAAAVGDHVHSAWTDAQGEHSHTIWRGNATRNSSTGSSGGDNMSFDGSSSAAGNHAHNVGVGGAGAHNHAITVAANGGAETRPKNMALLFCIKY